MKPVLWGLLLASAVQTGRAAPSNVDPDWPCQQPKVAELSIASVWANPVPALAETRWQDDTAVVLLVESVRQRRVPVDQAVRSVADFSETLRQDKDQKLSGLMTGVFTTLNHEHVAVVAGLDRFGQRQKALAEGLRQEGASLRAAQTAAPADDAKVADITQRLLWDQQLFESRSRELRFACEVPGLIEQRFFMLGKAIQEHLE